MNKEKELVKNTFIILLGKLCTQFVSFLLVPFYTFVLDTHEYGLVDLIITYIGLVVPILTIQLEMAMFRFLIDCRDSIEEQKKIFSNIVWTICIILIFSIILYFPIAKVFSIKYTFELICCVVFTIFSGLFLQTARGLGKNKEYSFASIVAGGSNLIFNLIFLTIFELGITGVLWATAISNCLCAMFLTIKLKLYKNFDINLISKKRIYTYIKYSLPLVPNTIIWWIINASDRTIISIFLNATANGIYAVANKFSLIIVSLYNVFNLSWSESAAININSKDKDEFFSNVFNKMLEIVSSLAIVFIGILPLIFNIIIDIKYAESYIYIPVLIIASIFNIIVMFIGGIYIAQKRTNEVAKTSLWSGILNIFINLLLIKKI